MTQVYARLLLSYLPDPVLAIKTCKSLLWPGGRLLIEDVDYSAAFCFPELPSFERYKEIYTGTLTSQKRLQVPCPTRLHWGSCRIEVSSELKGHPFIGPQLYSLVRQAGFEDVRVRVVQPICEGTDEGKQFPRQVLEGIRGHAIQLGLADNDELDDIAKQLEAFENDDTSLISLPRIFQVSGKHVQT